MSESYSDRWRHRYLEQHPEKATESQAGQTELIEPTYRTYPFPATTQAVQQPHSTLYPVPVTKGQVSGDASQQTHKLAAQRATSQAYKSTRELVSAACELRYQLRLTQRAFAKQLGINPRTWQEWEQGRRLPTGPGKALLEQYLAVRGPGPL